MGDTVVIKDVDEDAFRNLKGEAVKAGLKVGEAASLAFRLWVQSRLYGRVRDKDRLRKAANMMDQNRAHLAPDKEFSSVEVIRKWRERPARS